MDFYFSSVLQNTHNAWIDADAPNRAKVNFKDMCNSLAKQLCTINLEGCTLQLISKSLTLVDSESEEGTKSYSSLPIDSDGIQL